MALYPRRRCRSALEPPAKAAGMPRQAVPVMARRTCSPLRIPSPAPRMGKWWPTTAQCSR
jgi:hypothetical protein